MRIPLQADNLAEAHGKPELSIVVPSHGTKELTLSCLASLFAQSEKATEVIVVDDGSTDGTAAALRDRFPKIRVLVNEEPLGFSRAANRGLAEARGEILLLLNSDTEVEAEALSSLLHAFREDPRLGVAGAVLHQPSGGVQWSGGSRPSLAWLFALTSGIPSLLARCPGYRQLRPLEGHRRRNVAWVSGAAMAVRRRAWEGVGPFDERFRFYCQDLDLCLRLKDAGWRIRIVRDFRVLHYHGATISQVSGSVFDTTQPELLWTDLLRWAGKCRGDAWARRAAAVMRFGGLLRVLARKVATPFLKASRRPVWNRETEAFRTAVAAIPQS